MGLWVGQANALADSNLFDTNRVLDVVIQITTNDWNILRYQHRESEFFPEAGHTNEAPSYTWFPATVTVDGHRYPESKIRKKGYIGSNDTKRPGLKVQLGSSKARDPALPELELTLNNNNQDPAFLRQSLAYEVFRRAGVPVPQCNFARVSVNGNALGIFTHVEAIKRPFLKRWFGRDDGQLYEGGRSDFRTGWYQNFELKSDTPGPARADLAMATKAMEDTTRPLLQTLDRYLNLEEFYRYWAVESLLADSDGYAANVNNFYLYHDPATDRFNFIPWGKDSVMYPGGGRSSLKSVIGVGILANRVYALPEGRERYRATLRQVLEQTWDEGALQRELDRLANLIQPALAGSRESFQAAVDELRMFIKNRRAEITPELEGPAPELRDHPLELAKRRNVGHFDGTFAVSWTGTNPNFSPGAGSGSLAGDLFGKKLKLPKVEAQSGPFGGPNSATRPGLTIAGMDTDEGHGVLLYFTIDPESYAENVNLPVDNTHVFGGLLETDGNGQPRKMIGMLRGTLRFRAAGNKPTALVNGSFSVDVFSKLPGG